MTDFNDFDIAPDLAGQLDSSINGDAVRLSFAAPFLFWVNGNRQLRPAGGVPYFGGWATSAEDADAILAGRDLPIGFNSITMSNAAGKDYEAYCSRAVYAAKIGHREQWRKTETGKSQSHIQILVYLAEYDQQGRQFIPWGAAVLTGKGYSGNAIKTAFADWERKTQAGRKKFANSLSANLFYAPVGTFGNDAAFRMVGSGSQSPITPCEVKVAQDVNKDYLRLYFVGSHIAEEMADLKNQAEPWLSAWKDRKDNHGNGSNGNGAPEHDGYIGPPPAMDEFSDSIPF